jgi:hypothetical protein
VRGHEWLKARFHFRADITSVVPGLAVSDSGRPRAPVSSYRMARFVAEEERG